MLAITQIVLGLLISLTAAFVVALDVLPDWFHIRVRLQDGYTSLKIFNPDSKEVVATCLTILLLLLGLVVLGFGIVQLVERVREDYSTKLPSVLKNRNKRMAFIQTVLGVLIAISALHVFIWGFPTSYWYQLPSGEQGGILFTPGTLFVAAQQLSALTFLLGLAVIGCGVVQFSRVKKLA